MLCIDNSRATKNKVRIILQLCLTITFSPPVHVLNVLLWVVVLYATKAITVNHCVSKLYLGEAVLQVIEYAG